MLAEIRHADGQQLAVYRRDNTNNSYLASLLYGPISVHQSISLDNQYLGSVRITSHAGPVIQAAKFYIVIALLILAVLVSLAYLLAWSLQNRIVEPINQLGLAINRVSDSAGDFFQLPIETNDEIGATYNSFNRMLSELAERTRLLELRANELGQTLDMRNQQISEEERKRIIWLQNLAQFLRHELKNTMLGFRSSLDMIERRSDDEKIHQYIERARSSVIFMGKLLHNVGETSGLEAELLSEEFVNLNLSDTIQIWLEQYQHATGISNINFKGDSDAIIYGNATRIIQMVEKLATNAASHSKENTMIDVIVRKQDQEIILSVANQGTALPEERSDIFDLFVSMRDETRQTSDNVGLGLYIVRIIAQAHDGYVTADDLENAEGAIFSVHLPAQEN